MLTLWRAREAMKGKQQDHAKQAHTSVAHSFDGDLGEPITAQTSEHLKYVCIFTEHNTRWKELHPLRKKEHAVEVLHLFNLDDVVIPNRIGFNGCTQTRVENSPYEDLGKVS